MNCYIIGAGEVTGSDIAQFMEAFKKSDRIVVAVDGGYDHLHDLGIIPDYAVGDFDSVHSKPEAVTSENVISLNPMKDDTDMVYAVNNIPGEFDEYHIFGAVGGRIDHTIANIQLLADMISKNKRTFIHTDEHIMTAIRDESVRFTSDARGCISVLSHSDMCEHVTIRGLKYELEDANLTNLYPIGISNEFIGVDSQIEVLKGTAVLIYEYGTQMVIDNGRTSYKERCEEDRS